MPRNSAEKPRGRPFKPGNAGKPKGARHRVTLAVEALLDGEAERLTRKAVDMALAGDTTALRLCLERIAPPRKDAPVTFTLPQIIGPQDVPKALGAVLDAVAAGDLTPSEAQAVAGLLEGYRRAVETADIEVRLAAIEQQSGSVR